jgi:hypothetical protein
MQYTNSTQIRAWNDNLIGTSSDKQWPIAGYGRCTARRSDGGFCHCQRFEGSGYTCANRECQHHFSQHAQ